MSYEEIWERDARWIMGPAILGQIVDHLRGRSLIALRNADDPGRILIRVPLPRVKDEITGGTFSIEDFVPTDLRAEFNRALHDISETRSEDVERLDAFMGSAVNDFVVARMNAELHAAERTHANRGAQLQTVAGRLTANRQI